MEIPKRELELRLELLDAPESEKPALLAALVRLVEDRRAHGILAQTSAGLAKL